MVMFLFIYATVSCCPLVGGAAASSAPMISSAPSTRAFFGEMFKTSPSTMDFLFSAAAVPSTSVAKQTKSTSNGSNTDLLKLDIFELFKRLLDSQSASVFSLALPLPLTWCSASAAPFSVAAWVTAAASVVTAASSASRLSSPLAPSTASPIVRKDTSVLHTITTNARLER